jgi:hypothetical protein
MNAVGRQKTQIITKHAGKAEKSKYSKNFPDQQTIMKAVGI